VVQFSITVTNTGKSVLTVLPLQDTFEPLFLQFVSATVTPDFNLDGVVRWDDITTAPAIGDLQPGDVKSITVIFLALRDTYLASGGVTVNTATIQNGLADPDGPGPLGNVEPLPPATDTAPVQIDGPTAVLLQDSLVQAVGGAVSVNWSTVSESNVMGFNVLRLDGEGRAVRINERPVAAQRAGQSDGAAYTLFDSSADSQLLATGEYTYVLEILTLDGGATLVDLGGVSIRHTLFLPLLVR